MNLPLLNCRVKAEVGIEFGRNSIVVEGVLKVNSLGNNDFSLFIETDDKRAYDDIKLESIEILLPEKTQETGPEPEPPMLEFTDNEITILVDHFIRSIPEYAYPMLANWLALPDVLGNQENATRFLEKLGY